MTFQQPKSVLLFQNEISGAMDFAFKKILNIEIKKVTQMIESKGGRVVDYNRRNSHTIVLTTKSKQSNDEIQFDIKYVRDCIRSHETLPLHGYRLDKKVEVGCYYSIPFGSTDCIYSKQIQKGTCKKHNKHQEVQTVDFPSQDDDDKELEETLQKIKNKIYVEMQPQVKIETDLSQDVAVKVEADQD